MKKTVHSQHSSAKPLIFLSAFFTLSVLFNETVLLSGIDSGARRPLYIILFSMFSGIIFTLTVIPFRNGKARRLVGALLLALLGIIFSLETALHRSFGYFYPMETVIGMGGDVMGSYGGTIFQTVRSILIYLILYQIPTVAYLIVIGKSPLKINRLKAVSTLSAFALVLNGIIVYAPIFSTERNAPYTVGYDFDSTVRRLGLGTALKQNISCVLFRQATTSFITETPVLPPQTNTDPTLYNTSATVQSFLYNADLPESIAELNQYVMTRSPSEKNEKTGIFKGKNLIFICAEALSPYAVSAELTPTLYKLTRDGYNFTNYYSPTFGESTSGGEYALLLSQIPKKSAGEKGVSMQLAAKNDLSCSMPSFFRTNGYLCNGYHDNSYTYYGRNITHPALGMNWYGCGGYVAVDADAEALELSSLLTPGWPRSDRELIEATADVYIRKSQDKQKPFFTYYLTVSGHSNYSFNGNKMSAKNRDCTEGVDRSETVKAYLSAQKELDLALESLICALEENGTLENTVIAIANDHHPYGLSPTWAGNDGSDYLSELYGIKAVGKPKVEKGFFTIYCKGNQGEDISVPVSSFDVLPTLLNLFGIEYDSRILCGKDAFAPGERLVFFSDGSFITSSLVCAPTDRSSVDSEAVDRITNEIRALTNYSLSARKYNYFSHFNK